MPLHRRFLPILATLIVACAQVFGLQQGYLCEHGGSAVRTMVDHHHFGGDLHAWHVENERPHRHSEDDQHDTVPHPPLKVDLDVRQAPAALSAPVVVLWEEAVGDWQVLPGKFERGAVTKVMDAEPLERPPAAGLMVARAVVLRV
jgi:hypothetical protein